MKKVKSETRLEDRINSYFENNEQLEDYQIAINGNSMFLQTPANKKIMENVGAVVRIFKQMFLFLPGAFFLYKLPMSFIYFSNQLSMLLDAWLWLAFWLLGGSFLTYIGTGNLRETKNLAVPFSIIAFSLILGILFFIFPEPLRSQISAFYSIYLFPAALIIAGLTKISVDAASKEP